MTVNAADHGQHSWFEGERPVEVATPDDRTYFTAGDVVDAAVRVEEQAADDYEGATIPVYPLSVSLPTLLAGQDIKRASTTILNSGTDPIRVGKRSQVQAGGGFLLNAGASLEIKTTRAVYGSTAAPALSTNNVSVWMERNID